MMTAWGNNCSDAELAAELVGANAEFDNYNYGSRVKLFAALKMGKHLRAIKSKLPERKFHAWLDAHGCRIKQRQRRTYMELASYADIIEKEMDWLVAEEKTIQQTIDWAKSLVDGGSVSGGDRRLGSEETDGYSSERNTRLLRSFCARFDVEYRPWEDLEKHVKKAYSIYRAYMGWPHQRPDENALLRAVANAILGKMEEIVDDDGMKEERRE